MTLVCDTTVVYASLDRRDRNHRVCADLLAAEERLVLPSPTLVEVDQLAHTRGIPRALAALLGELLDGGFVIAEPDLESYARVRDLVETYADLPLGFVDATVVAIAERLGETTIATLDRRDFSVVKPLHCEAFTLVP
ncbi:MAG TPA: PIN domain-containing protein [Gaiellaceae bacterium]|nr:PIN domain-containing protein [Gaiellaceae bacterium]